MTINIHHGDCMDLLETLKDSSVDLILTDPPYFGVKDNEWDNQWEKASHFIEWLDGISAEWQRVLKPNGSLYCFASPQMSARVEVMLSKRFNILNNITWAKPSGRWQKCEKEALRGFFPSSERIVFCEHYGSDNMAKGEAGYIAKCDELRGFVFEPLRKWFRKKIDEGGLNHKKINEAIGSCTSGGGMASHYFGKTDQYSLPTKEHYQTMQKKWGWLFDKEYEELRKEYEELRKEYEELRKEYEELRRPFNVSKHVPYTDVWTFNPVQAYSGKHPCEKPQALLRHIIEASSRKGALVLDSFVGSGSTAIACHDLGRDFIGSELDEDYYMAAVARYEAHAKQLQFGF